jgi:hypothetical protein
LQWVERSAVYIDQFMELSNANRQFTVGKHRSEASGAV